MTKRIAPWIVFGSFVLYLAASGLTGQSRAANGIDLREFRRLPVSVGGRVQPIETVARLALGRLRGADTVAIDRQASGNTSQPVRLGADEWLLELLATPDDADARAIFPIATAEALRRLSIAPASGGAVRYCSFRDLAAHVDVITQEAQRVAATKGDDRAAWERDLLGLRNRLIVYERLKNSLQPNSSAQRDAKGQPPRFEFAQALGRYRADLSEAARVSELRKAGKNETLDKATELRIRSFAASFQAVSRIGLIAAVPPRQGEPRSRWRNVGSEIADSARGYALSPAVHHLATIAEAFARGRRSGFDAAVAAYRDWLVSYGLGREVNAAALEVSYNRLQPLQRSMPIAALGLALLFAAGGRRRTEYEAAVLLLVLAVLLQTMGVVAAFLLAGRPSFPVFAGWAVALCGVVIEWFSRRGLGIAVSGIAVLVTLGATYGFTPGGVAAIARVVLEPRLLAAAVASGVALALAVRPWSAGVDNRATEGERAAVSPRVGAALSVSRSGRPFSTAR